MTSFLRTATGMHGVGTFGKIQPVCLYHRPSPFITGFMALSFSLGSRGERKKGNR
ncbi:hypothetical protein GETHLI_03250 [Geothrix limicola]|uniref:Uncharacterized protein n=1 Tax=Geothrix limicola TaxID=2927978 RepID=A0ABQ5QB48_9BACT|nr:hypothetical protein GETHLI_03250 [Geothrix limicola]